MKGRVGRAVRDSTVPGLARRSRVHQGVRLPCFVSLVQPSSLPSSDAEFGVEPAVAPMRFATFCTSSS